jgi:hypothetical protein
VFVACTDARALATHVSVTSTGARVRRTHVLVAPTRERVTRTGTSVPLADASAFLTDGSVGTNA